MQRRHVEFIANRCLFELEAMGITVEIEQDFDAIEELHGELGRSIGKAHDHSRLLLTHSNSMWLFARRDGEIVVACGCRVDDLGGQDAASFLRRSVEVIFGVKVTHTKHQVFDGRDWGRAAYIGGLWSSLSFGLSSEGQKIIRLIMAYFQYRAMADFNADVNYCFLRGSDVRKAVSYGFLDSDPFVWETDQSLFEDGNPEWIMHLGADRQASLMASIANLLSPGLTTNQQPISAVKIKNAASG